ncbi:MAG: hypothetical protein PHE17_02495 [Thiothrix sp.]|uniref:hypothetical protein n=1 Tax=Thiothrix sp. TaxID=1032 RepID=UPI002604D5F1|nr:hypothetical protein [Thiothrix sp.]MDD5391869.1 hypothetical protein [Thiothrix sp.]
MNYWQALATSVWGAGLLLGNVAAFAGDRCNNFDIKIANQTGTTAKVTQVDYFDFAANQWRTEARIEQVLQDGVLWEWSRNLEHVGGALSKLRITYKAKLSGGFNLNPYSAARTQESATFTCADNGASPTVNLP